MLTCPDFLRNLIDEDDEDFGDDDGSVESFHYPGSSPIASTSARPPSVRSQGTDYFNRPTFAPRTSTDLTPHLSQAPEFRVPTHEAPQKVMISRRNTPTAHSLHAQWERDEDVTECHECKRRFSFLFRKVSTVVVLEKYRYSSSTEIILACKAAIFCPLSIN